MNQEMPDREAIDALTRKLYDTICFREGTAPNIESLRGIFIAKGQMINTDPEIPVIMTVDDFIEAFNEARTTGGLTSFDEKEISHKTEMFGRIAHRFSTYEARFDPESAEPVAVGINSIQFVKTEEDWKVAAMCWYDQTEQIKIPEKYLK